MFSRFCQIQNVLKERILVLDGAMGTMIQAGHPTSDDFHKGRFAGHSIALSGNNEVLNLTRPDIIQNVHRQYLAAGADIIETNTFNANRISQQEYGLSDSVYDFSYAGAVNARKMADLFTRETPDKPRFVAGSIGPTGKTASISPDVNNPAVRDVTFDELVAAYEPGIRGLIEGGADVLLIETVFDALNCKAAIYSAEQVMLNLKREIPVMISCTFSDASLRILSGQTMDAFLISVSHARNLLSVGCNCGQGAMALRPCIEDLAENSPFLISIHPNAGLPDAFGNYGETPEMMAKTIGEFARAGYLNIVGGCCGTTPAHIQAIAEVVAGITPHQPKKKSARISLSGLDSFRLIDADCFINIGERTNVAGSKKFLRIIREGDLKTGVDIARKQIESGARLIDINVDDSLLDSRKMMRDFLNYAACEPDVAKVPFMVDSSNWEVLQIALRCIQGKSIVNSISLKEGELPFLEKAGEIKSLGAAVLVMAFDEDGQADTLERRIGILSRAVDLLKDKIGFSEEDIVLDPNVFAVATGIPEHDSYAIDFIRAVEVLHRKYPRCNFSGGISNVSFSFRRNDLVRGALHAVFLQHAIAAGLNMGIVNPAQLSNQADVSPELLHACENVILNAAPDAGEKLLEIAARCFPAENLPKKETANVDVRAAMSLDERLVDAILKGDDSHLPEDMDEALQKYSVPMDIVEGPLMEGMRQVGKRFAEGRMFLPQVIKTARVMKYAVSILMPKIEAASDSDKDLNLPVVVFATVKGDVHDIGKNIVGAVLRCNRCVVHDLGVMVPAKDIADAAEKEHADMVGLSGLITPSLHEMEMTIAEFERRHIEIPILVGGAATSEQHTALKLSSRYSGPVVYAADAAATALAVNALMNPNKRDSFLKEMRKRYAKYTGVSQRQTPTCSYSEARKRAGSRPLQETPVSDSLEFSAHFEVPMEFAVRNFDWGLFKHIWKLPVNVAPAVEDILDDVKKILENCQFHISCTCRCFLADANQESVFLVRNGNVELCFPRNQTGDCLCVADFVKDRIGMFVVSVQNSNAIAERYREKNDEYHALLVLTVANVLAEAGAEYVHQFMMGKWGLSAKDGIRPAPGYPTVPDHSLKREIFALTEATAKTGAILTENFMMSPQSSVCAFVLENPEANYFAANVLDDEQISVLAKKRNFSFERMKILLGQE